MPAKKSRFHLEIVWGNSLEVLADDLFLKMGAWQAASAADILHQRLCILTPTRILQAWLQQRFLYDRPRTSTPHVLALVDFELLNYFLSARLLPPAGGGLAGQRADPDDHPFAVKSLRWRIYDFLIQQPSGEKFAPLRRYIARQGRPDPRKCFKLAGRLAKLLDEYQLYRPAMMQAWGQPGNRNGVPDALLWEPELWRQLIAGREDETILAAFLAMESLMAGGGIEKAYPQIFVFLPSALPPPHLQFLRMLGERLPVTLYLFNPAEGDWFDRDSLQHRLREATPQERPRDDDALLNLRHPLLDAYARGCRDTIAGVLDLTEGQIEETGFAVPEPETLLRALQRSLVADGPGSTPVTFAGDPSLQVHRCHGKMREVEILRDQLLACFEQMPGLQPRHIQVQVADLNEYAPYIEAVFAAVHPGAKDTIPFAIADRVAAGESRIAEAFRQLLELSDSRFPATRLLELLRCDGIARRFGFAPEDIGEVGRWLNLAGIRWGRDRHHRKEKSAADFAEETTWTYGLDRLFLGYALGQEPLPAAAEPRVIPCDLVEGDRAIQLGSLARFYERLVDFAEFSAVPHPLAEWAARLEKLLDDLLVSDNETYRDIGVLKSAIRLLRTSGAAADFARPVPIAVARDFLTGQLAETAGGSDLIRNAVLFSSLRPGSSTPRRVQGLLGMGDTLFPRMANRPAYDVLRETRRMGDRSATIEDRQAFLEVLLNARERLLILYPAFSEEDNSAVCESVVVQELLEYLRSEFGGGAAEPPYLEVRHRLQAWHPAYFQAGGSTGGGLFSFSEDHCATAQALLRKEPAPPEAPQVRALPITVDLRELIRFFENPARFFYQTILGADPTPWADKLPADTEPFEPNALETWEIRQRVIEHFVRQEPEENLEGLRKELVASGLCPLERTGEDWFANLAGEVEALLTTKAEISLTKAEISQGNLLDLLRTQKKANIIQWTLPLHVPDIGDIFLTGAAPVLPGNRLVDFFGSTHKIRRLFQTWFTHLLALAADKEEYQSLNVQGKKEKAIKSVPFQPLPSDEAQDWLVKYVEMYLREHSPPLPFAPESAWKYMETIKAGKSPADALREAQTEWTGSGYSISEASDPHLAAAFGSAGPFQDPAVFSAVADRILGPLWDHVQPQEK